jgi:hypothetical protein
MKVFLLSTLFAIAVLNLFLGYSGSVLSHEAHRAAVHWGIELSVTSQLAFAIQPWFYPLAFVALIIVALGITKKLPEWMPIYFIILFMALDIIGLLISTWGFGMIHFLL